MKKLVVYYSLEGNTRFIAETIAAYAGADLLELKQKKDINPKGLMKYFSGGCQVILKSKPELSALDKDPRNYDVIFIGTPIWAGSFTPPLRTFFSMVALKSKKIALFTTSKSGVGKTLEKMEKHLPENDFIGEMDFVARSAKEQQENVDKARRWVRGLRIY